MVKKNIQNLLPESMILSDSTTNNAVLQPPPRKKSLLDFSGLQPTNSSVSEIDDELQIYLESPVLETEPIPFWCGRNITELSILALQLLSVPRSSATVERFFSKPGVVLNQRRTLLRSSNLEQLLFYK